MKNLVEVIKANPGCIAIVDNDSWQLWKSDPEGSEAPTDDDDAFEDWERQNLLASDGDVEELGDGGYGSGNCCGGDILQALAAIVGIEVRSV